MKFLRVALIGCGIISEWHIRAYKEHADRAKITVCCDTDIERAKQKAELAGGAKAVASFGEVLADPDVDAVEIATPHYLHCQEVVAAAKAGKQILCQKPLAKTLEECDIMIAAARDAGVTLFYGEMNRTLPAAIKAKEVVDSGRIGRLIGMHGVAAHWQGGDYLNTAWRYDPTITGGGQLLDGGIHALDILLHVGGQVKEISCYTHRFREELGGEDTSVVAARFAGGHLGSLFSSQACGMWHPGAYFTAFGTEGLITLGGTPAPRGLVLHRPDLPDRHEVLLESSGDPFVAMIGHYLDTVLDGAPNLSPPEVGRETLRVILAAYEAERLGKSISLD
ncbi:MAG TPA: Gfo/Idh/MocA family oxidoreductase [Capsulimonadaceae bacterium]|nr:Gfo/Idh/MocA family oxidoreductase [Capsulimonadaceae bacterium]